VQWHFDDFVVLRPFTSQLRCSDRKARKRREYNALFTSKRQDSSSTYMRINMLSLVSVYGRKGGLRAAGAAFSSMNSAAGAGGASFSSLPTSRSLPLMGGGGFSRASKTARFGEAHDEAQARWYSSNSAQGVVAGFKNVSFGYVSGDYLIEEVDFSIKDGSKVTIMGQNGAGKSTIIKLLNHHFQPEYGNVNIKTGESVATAMQTMPQECREMTIKVSCRSSSCLFLSYTSMKILH
jgi:ABC-type transport system involved in cytochrome bd biosynthesis fused ATPase/permease subunit